MNKFSFSLLIAFVLTACSNDDSGTNNAATPTSNPVQEILASLDPSVDPEETTYQSLDGLGFELDAFAGQKVFVNYWATWCAPCIEEIPSINRAAEVLEREGYVFLLASDERIDEITPFLEEREFSGNFVKLNPFFAAYGISAVPSSILVDENGEIVKSWVGAYEWDSSEMLDDIRDH